MILLSCTSGTYYYSNIHSIPITCKSNLNASIVGKWMKCLDTIARSFDKSSFTRHSRKSLKMNSR